MAYDVAALLKIVAATLDDSAAAAKIATAKAAGVVIDDAAAMPQHAIGLSPARELPVVAKIATGSLINKALLVPLAIVLAAISPTLVTVLLSIGGAYLCLEGIEGLLERWHTNADDKREPAQTTERERVISAIKTDFVLSAEIIIIAMGTITDQPWQQQAITLVMTGLLMTVVVYGAVAIIVKIDDVGLATVQHGIRRNNLSFQSSGLAVVNAMPKVLSGLSLIGAIAMLLVGGSILGHNIHGLEAFVKGFGAIATLAGMMIDVLVGAIAGSALAGVAHVLRNVKP
jgi:predicted DNA repair protein MutK